MSRKRAYILLLLLLVSCLSAFPFIPASGDWIDDDYVFFEADPETITSSGWVTFTLLSKVYTGDVDLVWGFNGSIIHAKQPQIWANYTHTLWRWAYTYDENGTAHSYKEYYQETFPDWKPLGLTPQKKSFEKFDMDTWYLFKNVPIVAGKVYKVRAWMELDFPGEDRISGKYAFAMKRSIDTIQEAVNNDRFYLLDPWYDSTWHYKVQLTFNNSASSENLTDFPVMVHLDSSNFDFDKAQSDGDDLRFTDSDEATLLDYEIEEYNSTAQEAYIWVEVPQIDNGSITDSIFLYYGNTEASSGEEVEGTWNSGYIMVQHLQEATNTTSVDSTSNDNDGTPYPLASPPNQTDGQIGGSLDFDGTNDYVRTTSFDFSGWTELTWSVWFKGTLASSTMRAQDSGYFILPYPVGTYHGSISSDGGTDGVELAATATIDNGNWHMLTMTWERNTVNGFIGYVNGSATETKNAADVALPVGGIIYIGSLIGVSEFSKGIIDDVCVSNVSRSGDWIAAQYLSMTDDFTTYGSEEIIIFTVDLRVVNSSGLGLEDCRVTLTNTTGSVFSEITNSTGHITQQSVDYGDYTLTITKDGYITYEHDYEVNANIYWVIKLYTIEEGPVIQNSFNIELLILAGLSTVFMFLAWNDDPKDGIVRAAIAFFLWSTTSLWWMWETAGTEQVHFMYVFWMLALVSVMLFLSKLMQSYRYVGKKGTWIE